MELLVCFPHLEAININLLITPISMTIYLSNVIFREGGDNFGKLNESLTFNSLMNTIGT